MEEKKKWDPEAFAKALSSSDKLKKSYEKSKAEVEAYCNSSKKQNFDTADCELVQGQLSQIGDELPGGSEVQKPGATNAERTQVGAPNPAAAPVAPPRPAAQPP